MGAMGLALALIGLYGLMAYAVNRRTREIGIRMAMGALPASVLRMVLRQGTLPSIVGVAFGIVASAAVGGLIQGAIPGTGGDVFTYLLIRTCRRGCRDAGRVHPGSASRSHRSTPRTASGLSPTHVTSLRQRVAAARVEGPSPIRWTSVTNVRLAVPTWPVTSQQPGVGKISADD